MMELREKVARVIEPGLWPKDQIYAPKFKGANIKGLRECARRKADRLIEAGLIHDKEGWE